MTAPHENGRRLRVLEFIRPTTGGAARHVELLSHMIDSDRFEVHVATHDEPDAPFIRRLRDGGVHVETLNIRRSFHPFSDLRALRRILRLLRREDYDLVHCHAAKAGLIGRIACRIARVPAVLYTPHGFYFNYGLSWIKRRPHIWLERLLGRYTSRIVATAPREGAQIVELHLIDSERVSIIPNAIDTRAFTPNQTGDATPGRPRVVGMVGRLSPPKDPFTFLAAAKIVLEAHPTTRFVFVGDGELQRPAERAAADLGIAHAVEFLGYREDIREVIETFDVNVLSSLWEGLPYALVEGMALGKVAIGPDVSGCADLIDDGATGFLFPVRDHRTLARYIGRLLADDELREKIGRAGRAFVEERHSAVTWIRRVEGLYDSARGA